MARGEELTDKQWALLELLLPELPRRPDGRGRRPWRSQREMLRDLAKMQERAYHMGEWTEPVIRRYHALAPTGTYPGAAAIRAFHAWLFVPPALWPFNVLNVLAGCLDILAAGERLPARLELLAGLLPPLPNETVCKEVAEHEYHVQSGTVKANDNAVVCIARWRFLRARIRGFFLVPPG